MSKYKVTYPDATKVTISHEGPADELFEQLFSHLDDEVRAKCQVVPSKKTALEPEQAPVK